MPESSPALADLFPREDYRFQLGLRRGDPREFFVPRDSSGRILAERRHWLGEGSERYCAQLPEAAPLVDEFAAMLAGWDLTGPLENLPAPQIDLVGLSRGLEPDLLFLSPDEVGKFRLRAGAVCFPTGWAPQEKLGHTLDFIHGVVPGLNESLAAPIQQFLSRLKPGMSFERFNWGLAANDQLNLHPARDLPTLGWPVTLDRVWLRVEHQALVALPGTRGVLFGIRIALHRLDQAATDPAVARGLSRALESMPAAVAAYKGLREVRGPLVKILREI